MDICERPFETFADVPAIKMENGAWDGVGKRLLDLLAQGTGEPVA